MMAQTYFYNFEREDGMEITVEYSITPYDPGVSSGPAESCYPPEGGEVEIVSSFNDGGPVNLTAEEENKLPGDIFEEHDFSSDDYDPDDWRDR